MSYYFTKIISLPFEDAVKKVMEELSKEGFVVNASCIRTSFKPEKD